MFALLQLALGVALFSPAHASGEADEAKLPPAIQLPPLKTDEEKLRFLLYLKETVPNLFASRTPFDTNLFDLLDDQRKLQDLLRANPDYAKAFEQRKFHEFHFTPPPGGLAVKKSEIKPSAIRAWRQEMTETLAGLEGKEGDSKREKKRDEPQNALAAVTQALAAQLGHLDGSTARDRKTKILQRLQKDKANFTPLNSNVNKLTGVEQYERILALLRTDELKMPKEEKSDFMRTVEKARDAELAESKLVPLLALYSALNRSGDLPPSTTFAQAKERLAELEERDLINLTNRDGFLRPLVKDLLSKMKGQNQLNGVVAAPDAIENLLLPPTHLRFEKVAQDTEVANGRATAPVHLKEFHPSLAIVRGCVGGDCSSRFSFPYPNDPNERVYFVLDKDGSPKGYVSGTVVEWEEGEPPQKKKGFYIITVAGPRISAEDTEVIFRGLQVERNALGVDQVLVPSSARLSSLINFPEPRSIYAEHVRDGKEIPIRYLNPEFRKEIEEFKSDRNIGSYDHMAFNPTAVKPRSLSADSMVAPQTKVTEMKIAPPKLPEPTLGNVISLAMDLHFSGRKGSLERLLATQPKNRERFQQVIQLVHNQVADAKEPLSVERHGAEVVLAFTELGIADRLKHPNIEHGLYLGRLRSPDAFEKANIAETAKRVADDIRKTKFLPEIGWEIIHRNRAALYAEPPFRRLVQEVNASLTSGDREQVGKALERFRLLQDHSKETRDAIRKFLSQVSDFSQALQAAEILGMPFTAAWTEERELGTQVLRGLAKRAMEKARVSYQELRDLIQFLSKPVTDSWKEQDELVARLVREAEKQEDNHFSSVWFWGRGQLRRKYVEAALEKDPRIEEEIESLLKGYQRWTVMEATPRDSPELESLLRRLLSSSVQSRRVKAANVISFKYKDKDFDPLFVAGLNSADPAVREEILRGLGSIQEPERALPMLEAAVDSKHGDEHLAFGIAELYEYLGPPANGQAALKIISKNEPWIQEAQILLLAEHGLKHLEPKVRAEVCAKALLSSTPKVKAAAIRCAPKFDETKPLIQQKELLDEVVQLLMDADPDVREEAYSHFNLSEEILYRLSGGKGESPEFLFPYIKRLYDFEHTSGGVLEALGNLANPGYEFKGDVPHLFLLIFSRSEADTLNEGCKNLAKWQKEEIASVVASISKSGTASAKARLADCLKNDAHKQAFSVVPDMNRLVDELCKINLDLKGLTLPGACIAK